MSKVLAALFAGGLAAGALMSRPAFAEEPAQVAATRPEPAEAQLAEKGKVVYARNCSHCHGFNMVNPGTISYDLRQFPHDAKARFVHSVTEGKNGRMPRWGDLLSPEEIEELWAYVKTGGEQ
jgi:mono/diheme cytochrome c family protein